MVNETRLAAFIRLGQRLTALTPEEINALAARARNQNSWFDLPNVTAAIAGITQLLDAEPLRRWAARYPPSPRPCAKSGW